jgi:hypothetical protein
VNVRRFLDAIASSQRGKDFLLTLSFLRSLTLNTAITHRFTHSFSGHSLASSNQKRSDKSSSFRDSLACSITSITNISVMRLSLLAITASATLGSCTAFDYARRHVHDAFHNLIATYSESSPVTVTIYDCSAPMTTVTNQRVCK